MKQKIGTGRLVFLILLAVFVEHISFGCKPQQAPATQDVQNHLITELQYVLDTTYAAHPDAVGLLVHVQAPDQGLSWTGAAGSAQKNTKEKLDPHTPVLIASNTKTYVAAAIVKQVEQGHFQLDDAIAKLLTPSTQKLLSEEGYAIDQIKVRHLLSHTSGIADYVDDAYFDTVHKQPKRNWERKEQMKLAMQVAEPLGPPGQQFQYADLNYLLLTEIIETQSQKPFYTAIRELLDFKKHGLNTTWWANLEKEPQSSLPTAHQYWNKRDWDSYEINPSWDLYGGGGLIANAQDMGRFFSLLFEGKIIEDQALLSEMWTYVLPKETSNYCLGLRNISFHGRKGYYHGGFWGTDVLYLPETGTSVAAICLEKDTRYLNERLSADLLKVLLEHRLMGLYPVKRLHKDSNVMVSRLELRILFQKGIQIAQSKAANELTDEEHVLLIMLSNTGNLYLPENDLDLSVANALLVDYMEQMDYTRKAGDLMEWIPNRGLGMHFTELDINYGGAKPFGWEFFEVVE